MADEAGSPAPGGVVTSTMKVADTSYPSDLPFAYRGAGAFAYRDAAPVMTRGNIGTVRFRLESANQEIVRERRQAVINSREIDRNNAMVHSGISKRAVDMVGANLRLQSMPNFEALGLTEEWAGEFAQSWENEFSLWGDDPRKLNDAERHSNFGGQMLESCRNTYGADGEAALIIRYNEDRMKRYRGKFATFVEVLDPDRISNPDGKPDSEFLCQGRELDEWGGYVRLQVEKRHPSNPRGKKEWIAVERETAMGRPVGVHWFPRFRAGAQRAMPAIIGSLRDVRMLDSFDEKTLEQAVKAAFMSIYIKTDATTADALAKLQAAPTGGVNDLIGMIDQRFGVYEDLNMEGQNLPVLVPGDDIGIAQSTHAANNQDSFRFAFERKFASNLGLSYARFSNDYSKTSFASIRAEFIDAWRMTYADRYLFCSSVPALVALAHLEECIVRRRIILPTGAPDFYDNMTEYAQCEFRGPGMGWVDPVKDVSGAGLRVLGGFSSPQAEAAAQGSDFFDNINATSRAMKYAEKKNVKITFGTKGDTTDPAPDPAEVAAAAGNGGLPAAPAPAPEPAPPKEKKP